MAKANFTDLAVKNLPAPLKGQRSYWDANLPGFGIRVSQGGAKSWIVMDPKSKTRIQETIGRYPVISLQEARSEAKRRLAEATLGKHRPRTIGWNAALQAYLKEVASRRKPGTHAEYKRLLEKYFRFGTTNLGDLAPNDLHKKLEAIDAPSERRHAFVAVRAFANWAEGKNYFAANPIRQVKVEDPSKPGSRTLTDDELKSVWHAAGDDLYGRIVKLLLLTGQRRSEIANLAPKMLGDGVATFPPWLTKNKREHTIPWLSEAAKLLAGDGPPDEPILGVKVGDGKKAFSAWSKNKIALDERSGVTGWMLHDLRRTFRTGLGRLGVRPDIAERIVNHVSSRSDMEEVYDRWRYLPEMSGGMAKWQAHVLRVVGAEESQSRSKDKQRHTAWNERSVR